MAEQLWLAVLSSSVISAILGALVGGAYGLRAKRNEYVNDYYKRVVERRIAAYEQLESLILALKASVLGDDNRPYHLLFSQDDDWESAHKLVFKVMSQALWLSDEAFEKARDLNYRLFRLTPSEGGAIEFGKQNYHMIAELRSDLERILAADMLELHDVERFLRQKKKKESEFHHARLHG